MKSHYELLLDQTKQAALATMVIAGLTLSPLATADEPVQTMRAVSEGRMTKGQLDSFSIEDKHKQIEILKSNAKQQLTVKKQFFERDARIAAYQQGQLTQPVLSSISPQQTAVDTKGNIGRTQVQQAQQSVIGYRDFAIFQAYSRLFDDLDEDGFYQTFSVTFDADVYGYTLNEPANVYAEMYLSRNGGPWEHYYTTDVFTIYGQSEDDDFEVLTTLSQGYQTDYYDVLIDLYEYGYPEVVATLSADEADGLYALALESHDRDVVYEQEIVEEVVIVGGGSLSWGALILLIAGLFSRRGMKQKID
ncbi:choice-of-anchor H family protein [Shewanella holmiensis]|uniref:Choice-of-anchor H family protein n=1 Tax=Shewanella holmiensis TaxID=2952222 RepID=A0A9X2WLP0_9GAMM|nr:choice-of-anchor H family protein [Shewanella holmiensis]MCT7941691.1 choice-of-anchor H family protein [Shewanella holmiensis]